MNVHSRSIKIKGTVVGDMTGTFDLKANGRSLIIDIIVTSGTGTVELHDSSDGFDTVDETVSSLALSSGVNSFEFLDTKDSSDLPLRTGGKLVLTAASSLVIDKIILTQPY